MLMDQNFRREVTQDVLMEYRRLQHCFPFLGRFRAFEVVSILGLNVIVIFLIVTRTDWSQGEVEAAFFVVAAPADYGQIHQRFLLPALLQLYNYGVTTREGCNEKKTWSNIVHREVLVQIRFPDYFLNRFREYLNRERDAFIVRD